MKYQFLLYNIFPFILYIYIHELLNKFKYMQLQLNKFQNIYHYIYLIL